MSPLDQPNTAIDESTVSPMSTIVRYGLIGGLLLVVYTLLGNTLGFSRPSGGIMSMVINLLFVLIFYPVLCVLATKKHRDDELGGYISLGRAFVVAFGTGLIASVISVIFNYIYMTVIDPNYMADIADEAVGMYEKMGMSEEQIDAAVEQLQKGLSLSRQFLTFGIGAALGAIPSIIIALVMKKEPPATIEDEA